MSVYTGSVSSVYTPTRSGALRFAGAHRSVRPVSAQPVDTGYAANSKELEIIRDEAALDALIQRFSYANIRKPNVNFNTQAAVFITQMAPGSAYGLALDKAEFDAEQQRLRLTTKMIEVAEAGTCAFTPVGLLLVFDKQYLQNPPELATS